MKSLLKNICFGLVISAVLIAAIELCLGVFGGEGINVEARKLAPLDRGSLMLAKNGYRGKRPCSDCSTKPLRIITMGGSSVFGVPMYYSAKTYSAVLQRIFDQRAPVWNAEVLNGGVAGFGIWQVVEALENKVLKDKPDIVMISSWFNDSSFGPGWYGFEQLSDLEAYQEVKRLRAIETNQIFQLISGSNTYGAMRQILSGLAPTARGKSSQKKRKRSTAEEFAFGLERVQVVYVYRRNYMQ
jgi:hypothetical protein